MKNWITYFVIIAGISVLLISCQNKNKKVANLAPNAHQVTAEEVLQTSSYTYVRVLCDGKDYWVAISKMEVKEGETYFWSRGMPMNDFTSKELKRTFPMIFFVEDFTDKPITTNSPGGKAVDISKASRAGKQQAEEQENISVKKAPGGITIAELYSKKESYAGKTVTISGQVVRFAKEIMKKNWVHIQDGTKEDKYYDLTITTTDIVKFGDEVIFKGTISLDKDFGAGYVYDVIMEDAKLIKKQDQSL